LTYKVLFFFPKNRLEETTVANENLLLREREQNDITTKAHNESQEKYEELLSKFIDVDRKIDLLQGTIERYVICLFLLGSSRCLYVMAIHTVMRF
jgi:hypothetical protein